MASEKYTLFVNWRPVLERTSLTTAQQIARDAHAQGARVAIVNLDAPIKKRPTRRTRVYA